MKKINLLLFTIPFVLLSCKKDKETEATPGVAAQKHFYMKMDGVVKDLPNTSTQHTSGIVFMSGSSMPGESIRLILDDTLTAGTYAFTPNGPIRMSYTPDNYATSYSSINGSANISSFDTSAKQILGTFNCTLVSNQTTPDTIQVTAGEFFIKYP